MSAELAVFFGIALVTVVASIVVVAARNPLYSALALIVALIATAAVFVVMQAHFLAAVQIILYAGAIMVLFVFVIMLIRSDEKTHEPFLTRHWEVAGILAVAMFGLAVAVFWSMNAMPAAEPVAQFGTVKQFGRVLIYDYFWVFEVTTLLLIAAIVGAAAIMRREPSKGERR